MLVHVSTQPPTARALPGTSHIVIALNEAGFVCGVDVFFRGQLDTAYGKVSTERLLQRLLPQALGELAAQSATTTQQET